MTTLLWIPGYQWIASNEEVNACATTITDGALRLVPFTAASALILETLMDHKGCLYQDVFMAGRLTSCLHAARRRSPRPPMSWPQPFLNVHANQLDRIVGTANYRAQLFGEPSPSLSILTAKPANVIALGRKTLL